MSKQESSESAADSAAAPVARSESKSQCKADQYKDANCPQTKKEQRKLLRKVHPDKYIQETKECKETAGEITRRITQCQYDENGELNTDAIFAELQQNAAEAEAAESANQAVKSNMYGTNRSTTVSDTYLGWYINNPDIVHPSESSEEQTLKKTMLAFRELVESPLNVNYPFPDLPNEIEDVPYGESNPNEGLEDEIKQNFRAYMAAKRQKESAIRALAKDVRKAHDALAAKKPELAGRERSIGSVGRRIRWVRKNPRASKQKFNLRWSTGVLKRPYNSTPVNIHGVQPGSGPWYSGGKKKANKTKKNKTKKNKAKKKNKGKKTRVKWYGRKNVWVKFGKNKECNHKLRRCRTLKRTMVSKSKSTTKKSTTRKSTTKKSTTKKSTTRNTSKNSKRSSKKKTRKIFQ